eukprot:NODE_3122_length_1419_cov_41.178241_g2712_i0.p1 GENE.NODE_3122_length_1419_cov_41.178241_g2712_i0~~NODE_3122_length_1419_cov_41.178241_g2712_i0.p1  ORF type:complete len:413 (-),score=66.87 NODE_3122_length_1419_cov_41.178241_g2712_i0:136-1374(-)
MEDPYYESSEYDVHVSSCRWKSKLWKKTKIQKTVYLEQRAVYPVGSTILACVEIQRIWRGVLVRRRVLSKYLYNNFTRLKEREYLAITSAYSGLPVKSFAPAMIDLCRLRIISRIKTVLKTAQYSRWLAYQKIRIYYVAASAIGRFWLNYRYKKRKLDSRQRRRPFYLTPHDSAAATIQRSWKSYLNKQIFRFYIDLIKFREGTDAKVMLKCINPHEASLIDAASNMHVRFRLGGSKFPPQIYYKLFVHGPVCDLGALAPRDYTAQRSPHPRSRFNKTYPSIPQDTSKWYKRIENNDWRPISEKVLRDADHYASKMFIFRHLPSYSLFHHNKSVRREERNKLAKRKHRKWIMDMYSQSMSITESILKLPDLNKLDDSALEKEVQGLVKWTEDLDFEAYQNQWLQLATASSDF